MDEDRASKALSICLAAASEMEAQQTLSPRFLAAVLNRSESGHAIYSLHCSLVTNKALGSMLEAGKEAKPVCTQNVSKYRNAKLTANSI